MSLPPNVIGGEISEGTFYIKIEVVLKTYLLADALVCQFRYIQIYRNYSVGRGRPTAELVF